MTTAMSKRNQARNERALQELLKTVPGNDRCADCAARNPGWASWSLGIFLCIRCAALHRKLGTHISKVKSLSMDSWTNDQVENMKNIGNIKSNQIFNPKAKAPIVPIDQDEVDGAVEWFIRQKYVEKAFQEGAQSTRVQQIHRNQTFGDREAPQELPSRRRPTESPSSPTFDDIDVPTQIQPHAAPKPSKKFFGLRSASSTFNLGRKNRERKGSLPAGHVVGAAIGLKEDGMEWKLVALREMGFSDEKRNTEILKGMNGDLERAIESLVRLGQGPGRPGLSKKVSTTFTSSAAAAKAERTKKPAPISSSSAGVFGASVKQSPQSTGFSAGQSSASSPGYRKTSNNPFDTIQPQTTQSSQSNINQAFNNMSISQPMSSQSTGILPSQQAPQQVYYQQSMTPPPGSQMPQQYGYNPYMQQPQQQQQQYQQMQPLQTQATGYNPFLQNQPQPQQQMPMPQSNPFMAQQLQPQMTSNPFMQNQQSQTPQTPTSNSFLQQQNNNAYANNNQYQQQLQYSGQQQVVHSPGVYQDFQTSVYDGQQSRGQQQQYPFPQGQQQQPQQQQFQAQLQQPQQTGYSNPFMQQQQTYPPQQGFQQTQFQQNQFSQPQPLMAQPTGRMNKQSILALYSTQPSIPEHPEQQQQQQTHVPQRSVTVPASMSAGTNSPFGAVPAATNAEASSNGRMRDSIFAGTDDPFASLSAKIR